MMNRITLSFIFICILFLNGCTSDKKTQTSVKDDLYSGIEFDMPVVQEPVFPDLTVNLEDFGAVTGGQVKNTKAFADAIEHVYQKGGGKIIVSRGLWLTGPIIFKSNIHLHLEPGAFIIFSKDFDDYPLVKSIFEGLETYRCISPIYAADAENIAITGTGVIDGSGEVWRQVKKSKTTEQQWQSLIKSGGLVNKEGNTWYPSEKSFKGSQVSEMNVPQNFKSIEDYEAVKDFLRPVMVNFIRCKKILLDGPTFQNSPAWNIHPILSEDITLRNLIIRNPWYAQNGDGLDLESCKNTIIYRCNFDVGDDAICIKSGKNEEGRKRGVPTENAIIKECIVYHGHGGFVVGSEMSGGVRNIHVSNCTFIGTDVGLRFKSTRGRGGIVENIYISNIDMINIPTDAIGFNLYYGGNSPVPEPEQTQVDVKKLSAIIPPVTEETPQFRNIYCKNIVCKGAAKAIHMRGLPEMNLFNLQFENIKIESDQGIICYDADSIQFTNVWIKPKQGPVTQIYNSKNINMNNLQYDSSDSVIVKIEGELNNGINIQSSQLTNPDNQIIFGDGVDKSVLNLQ